MTTKTEALEAQIAAVKHAHRAWEEYGNDEAHEELALAIEALPDALSTFQEPEGAAWQEPKYRFEGGRVINRASGEAIPLDEPVFVLRGRDLHARMTISYYMNRVETVADANHYNAVRARFEQFGRFRDEYRDRMKEPDTESFTIPASNPALASLPADAAQVPCAPEPFKWTDEDVSKLGAWQLIMDAEALDRWRDHANETGGHEMASVNKTSLSRLIGLIDALMEIADPASIQPEWYKGRVTRQALEDGQ